MRRVDVLTTTIDAKYRVSEWQRKYNIRYSCQTVKNRIEPVLEDRLEPVAIACSGPSFKQTWEQIKPFKHIMSCGGAYRFLMERGIEPEIHVDCDPMETQVHWIGDKVSPKTTFYVASSCHPKLIRHIMKYTDKIILWHTNCFGGTEIHPVFPRGEWFLNGGSNVGLRSIVLARFLGFTDIHIFGMDGSFDEQGNVHIQEYYDEHYDKLIAEFNGRDFITNMDYLHGAKGLVNELKDLPDIKATFYGDGLIQNMMRHPELCAL